MRISRLNALLWVLLCTTLTVASWADDWPTWGGSQERNNASAETGLPDGFPSTNSVAGGESGKALGTVQWSVKLGGACISSPVVASGHVYIGSTNNLGDPRYPGDRDVLQCLDETTGKMLWALNLARRSEEPGGSGEAAPPTVVGNRVYLFTTSGILLCLDADGWGAADHAAMANEATYLSSGRTPITLTAKDAGIIWTYDPRTALKLYQHDSSNGVPVVANGLVFCPTSNGNNDRAGYKAPAPDAPSLIALDAKTGALVAQEEEGIGHHLIHGEWSSPAYGEVPGPVNADGTPGTPQGIVLYGAGDGFLYAFSANVTPSPNGKVVPLKCLWKFDADPVGHQAFPTTWTSKTTRTEIISTPVISDGLAYVTTGQDPDHGPGLYGGIECVDLATGVQKWAFTGVKKVDSTPAVANGLLFVADMSGALFCLDAKTGKQYWTYKMPTSVMGSVLAADGKVYVTAENGTLAVLAANTAQKLIYQGSLGARSEGSPCAANGTLYIPTYTTLYAVTK